MLLLTHENHTIDLDLIGKQIEKTYFGIFNAKDPSDKDYHFNPLTFIEQFETVGVLMQIGDFEMVLPASWSMIVGDPESTEVDIMPIEEMNGRSFKAFCTNPLVSSIPEFLPVKMLDVYPSVGWTLPRLNLHEFLVTPLPGCKSNHSILIIDESIQKKLGEITFTELVCN